MCVKCATGFSLGRTPGAITTENIAVRATGRLVVAVLAGLVPMATGPAESPQTELTFSFRTRWRHLGSAPWPAAAIRARPRTSRTRC